MSLSKKFRPYLLMILWIITFIPIVICVMRAYKIPMHTHLAIAITTVNAAVFWIVLDGYSDWLKRKT